MAVKKKGMGRWVKCDKCGSRLGYWTFEEFSIKPYADHIIAKQWDRWYGRHVQMICYSCNDYVEFELPWELEDPQGNKLTLKREDEDVFKEITHDKHDLQAKQDREISSMEDDTNSQDKGSRSIKT